MEKFVIALIVVVAVISVSYGQATPEYTIERAVVAAAGGTMTSDTFTVESTLGQTVVGFQAADNAAAPIGFWFADLQPTAASVSISGRVIASDGRGISGARLALMDANGVSVAAIAGSLGYYRFDNIQAGATYVLSITAKQHTFAQPSILISASDEIAGLDFIAIQ